MSKWFCSNCGEESSMYGHSIAGGGFTCKRKVCEKCHNKCRPNAKCLCDTELTLDLLLSEAYGNAQAHGFKSDIWQFIGNLHGECSEAWEEARKPDFDPTKTYYSEGGKPEGLPSELADIIIRVADTAKTLNIDLGKAIIEKMVYNRTRPYKHGNKRA